MHGLHVMGSCTHAHHGPAQVLCVTGRACGPSQCIIYTTHKYYAYSTRTRGKYATRLATQPSLHSTVQPMVATPISLH